MLKSHVYPPIMGILLIVVLASSAHAQQPRNDYDYCKRRAEQLSGYQGETPRTRREGGVIKGAISGAAIGAIFGDNKESARRGAALGALFGGIKRAQADKEADRKRRLFQIELDECMASR